MRSWLNTIVVGVVISIAAFLATPTLAKEPIQVTRGNIFPLAAGLEDGYTISGQAEMVRSAAGHTTMILRVQGLVPNTSYSVNVHNLACSIEAGGGHYQHEVDGAVDNINEMWQVITTRSNGYGNSRTVNNFVARSEARSVVIHSMDNTSLACADLSSISVSPYTFGTTRIEEIASINAVVASWDQAKKLSNPNIAVSPYTLGTTQIEDLASLSTAIAANPELVAGSVVIEVRIWQPCQRANLGGVVWQPCQRANLGGVAEPVDIKVRIWQPCQRANLGGVVWQPCQ